MVKNAQDDCPDGRRCLSLLFMPMISTRPNAAHRVRCAARTAGAMVVGALCGFVVSEPSDVATASATLSVAPPGTASYSGSGYGGTASWLTVVVGDQTITVRGSGFRAGSSVTVQVGSTSVLTEADDVGAVGLSIPVGELGEAPHVGTITANGMSADGTARSVSVLPKGADSTTLPSAVSGAIGGFIPFFAGRQRKRRTRNRSLDRATT